MAPERGGNPHPTVLCPSNPKMPGPLAVVAQQYLLGWQVVWDGGCLRPRLQRARHSESHCSPPAQMGLKHQLVFAVSRMIVGKLQLREKWENKHQALGLENAFLGWCFFSGKQSLKISVEKCYFFSSCGCLRLSLRLQVVRSFSVRKHLVKLFN